MTPEQHLKGIFLNLYKAERLREPERTETLRKMIRTGLDIVSHVRMPEENAQESKKKLAIAKG